MSSSPAPSDRDAHVAATPPCPRPTGIACEVEPCWCRAETAASEQHATPEEWDEWLTLYENRDAVAFAYAQLLGEFDAEWVGWRELNEAILRRWSPAGLRYIKESMEDSGVDRSAACDHCDDTGEVLEPSRTPEEPDYFIPCANCRPDSAAHTGDADRLRALMDEWEATAEMGWSRPLSVEEARCVLSALSEGVAAMTTAEWERMRTVSRG